ncbi:MAG TPA: LON peptidase substrate-binding domain-containing protein [Thermoanaerobaculia bacterium]|nr:LON peptidase substrate-binding domain-containing protein [Thermoanaerobaculia bacterium]
MTAAAAPSVLPLFPLTGSLLLPGNWLPLNVFEPRYRNLVADAMPGERQIGMIQPFVPRQDNWPALDAPPAPPDDPRLYTVGCAGRIESCELQADGRYVILLKGVRRFRVLDELPLLSGYRRAVADYSDFEGDLHELSKIVNPSRVMAAIRAFGTAHELSFDFDLLASLPGVSLVNGLSVALPFRPAEKQALLEAAGPAEREELLLTLMGMGVSPLPADEYYSPPTLN